MSEEERPSLIDHPAQLLGMGKRLIEAGRIREAAELVQNALNSRPDDRLVRAIAETLSTYRVPTFHLAMLEDDSRNLAFRLSIEAAARGRKVLDIGTGSGLLAMMAVRAGASHVYACEQDSRLAATAQQIVQRNGFGDRITVLASHSTKLDRDRDLGGGVDLVIAEVFGRDLLSEGALEALRDARARLCLPDPSFLPARVFIRVALADYASSNFDQALEDVEGFDLSLFQRHLPQRRSIKAGDPRLQLRSAPDDLFAFDFLRTVTTRDRVARSCISQGGRVTGIVQWIALDFGASELYENAPRSDARSHWGLNYFTLAEPLETAPGQEMEIAGWRDGRTVLCWADIRR